MGNFYQKMTVKCANVPILINQGSYEKCRHLNKRATLIPAFIPPQKKEKLQDELLSLFDKLHKDGKKVVSTNAYNISYDKSGNDTYGIGFLVEFFEKSNDYTLVISDPSGNYTKMFERKMKEGEGQNTVFFINYPHSYFELLKHVDFFVRNTSTDGDALSVKEALYLGVPVLCSDVVDRPSGVRLFKYSDNDSFEIALNMPQGTNKNIENGALSLLEVYKRLGVNLS
jgi:glycosyltransferase involved in cell wall biosynthesis